MAITVINPNSLCFAGNPIIVRATTDKHLDDGESMLRIILEAVFTEKYDGGAGRNAYTFSTELSQPVGNGGTAVFNLSDASQTIIKRLLAEMDMNDGSWKTPVGIGCSYTCREVWVEDGYEQGGGGTSSYNFDIVPGFFTDFEMLTRASIDLNGLALSEPHRMTRKPDPGIVYEGETVILPMLSKNSVSGTYYLSIGGTNVSQGNYSLQGSKTGYVSVTASGASEGGVLLHLSSVGPWTNGYYRTNTNGVHFLRFINGFGAVENISVRSKDKLSYEVSGETHSLVQGVTTRPTDRRYATKSQPVGVYELSSGYVPKQWAEWYVQELLTSPRVWIQLGGKWVPALIEAEDDCVIYDRTKPEMPHVDFTLRLAIDGVTGITW